ncbi:hypothetical protein QN372_15980 [Undibacterium sp. RTI2.1]|uniref:hypothetical protein n=1 Tax=unclassified Undibacterium TaxID=2630295 RepID=UPI002AB3F651|nr:MULTISPECIES: hypothetical protein [unclassified Undibacterium]MDY7537451.1 hypothetical protein [Undibacterium sp. 5I1]MEB0032258.1 hypothetical protein [Undibacterium sp. RTI2.1]MEB0118394.1 hypothetical protein [Undibacterium sp. RTI2.2]MEB0232065.1 hypothetical protein [Undibacterium sp. 10I3]MEB0259354.1 hypothetical protein [Undibacterium sp. 5I1]
MSKKEITMPRLMISALSICTVLVICAPNAFSQETDMEQATKDNFKHGWVTHLYDAKSDRKDLPECLEKLSDSERENKHFAKIHYKHARRGLSTIAEVPEYMSLKLDDEVDVVPENCDKGKFAHIVKILTAK